MFRYWDLVWSAPGTKGIFDVYDNTTFFCNFMVSLVLFQQFEFSIKIYSNAFKLFGFDIIFGVVFKSHLIRNKLVVKEFEIKLGVVFMSPE